LKVKDELLSEEPEVLLAKTLKEYQKKVVPMINDRDYKSALTELAGLRESVDSFFDNVMVMCDDDDVKNNRLALLSDFGIATDLCSTSMDIETRIIENTHLWLGSRFHAANRW